METNDSEDEDAGVEEDDANEEPTSAWQVTSSMEINVKDEGDQDKTADEMETDEVGGMEAEPVVARGLAATLQLARSKGMLQEIDKRHGRTVSAVVHVAHVDCRPT